MKLHEQINQLIPYIGENVISYRLWEEGIYLPFVTFWQQYNYEDAVHYLEFLTKSFEQFGYGVDMEEPLHMSKHKKQIYSYIVYPDFDYRDDGGYFTKREDWSIEEIFNLIIEHLKGN